MNSIDHVRPNRSAGPALIVGLYSWILAASFGAVVLDVVYSSAIEALRGPSDATQIFAEVSDFLLWPLGLAFISAIAAVRASWKSTSARNLIIASAVVIFAQIPGFVLLKALLSELDIGTWVRLIFNGGASLLAMAAMSSFVRGN